MVLSFIQVRMILLMINHMKTSCTMPSEISHLMMMTLLSISVTTLSWRNVLSDSLPISASTSMANRAAHSSLQRVWDECRQLNRLGGDGPAAAETATQAKHHSPKKRKRSFTCFKHGGHDICMKILHTIGRSYQGELSVERTLSRDVQTPMPCRH